MWSERLCLLLPAPLTSSAAELFAESLAVKTPLHLDTSQQAKITPSRVNY